MASVRAIVTFAETDVRLLTFKYDNSIVYSTSNYDGSNHSAQVGMAVTLVSDSTVGLGTSGGRFIGKLVKVERDGFCTVQVGGGMQVPYTPGSNPALVGRGVRVDGSGNVITNANGGVPEVQEKGLVLSVDGTSLASVWLGA